MRATQLPGASKQVAVGARQSARLQAFALPCHACADDVLSRDVMHLECDLPECDGLSVCPTHARARALGAYLQQHIQASAVCQLRVFAMLEAQGACATRSGGKQSASACDGPDGRSGRF
jgi:hypothetical protein